MQRRLLDLSAVLKRKSVLLLGPRQTGKSTLLAAQLPTARVIDLLDSATYRSLSGRPERLTSIVESVSKGGIIAIDEVQRVPELLNEVHRHIERRKDLRFVLTGSSARKLRRGGVNLLGGRAARLELFPLVSAELGADSAMPIPLERMLQWGGLPGVVTGTTPEEDLRDYIAVYLREEIQAEASVRNLPAFARFLEAIAGCNGEQLVFANVSRDAEVPVRTVRDYVELLEDTLIATVLPAFRSSSDRKARAGGRFFFFDVGLANVMQGRVALTHGTNEYGRAIEHLVFCELRAALSYRHVDAQLSYWRTHTGLEVDFVVSGPKLVPLGIEVKATHGVSRRDTRGLRTLAADLGGLRQIVVCQEPLRRVTQDGVEIWPLSEFLPALWDGTFWS